MVPVVNYLSSVALLFGILCQSAGAQAASVEGDVYLVMKNGDVKPAASNMVILLTDSAFAAINASVCKIGKGGLATRLEGALAVRQFSADSAYDIWRRERRTDPKVGLPSAAAQALQRAFLATRDSLNAEARDWPRVSADLIAAASRRFGRTAPTGMKAHYRFDNVLPGRYVVLAGTTLYSTEYFWWSTVTVPIGATVTKDLDNERSREGILSCAQLSLLDVN